MQTPTLFSDKLDKHIVAIDPGRNTGIAVMSVSKMKIVKLLTSDFWGTIQFIQTFPFEIEIIIEDPQLNKPIFFKVEDLKTEIDIKILIKRAQSVGRNKECAFLMVEYLTNQKINFTTVRPGSKKWSPEEFFTNMGWTDKSNEHTRDAAKLLFNHLNK